MELTQSTIMDAAYWAYDKATGQIPVIGSAEELALQYADSSTPLDKQISSLINWQCSKTFLSGFVTGLGGIITLPVSVPAEISASFFHQLRMAAAIAYLAGNHQLNNDKIRTFCIACLCGMQATEILKGCGVSIGTKFAKQAIKSISADTIRQINKRVGFRLLTKFGEKGVINLGKTIPFVGGVIGGTFNVVNTKAVGAAARKVFTQY